MRTLRLTVLLGLAALAWKSLKPKLPAAKAQVARAREQIEPVLRDLTRSVRVVSKDTAETVRDVTLGAAEAAESVRDASLSAAETADSVANAIEQPAPAAASDGPRTGETHET